MTKTPANSVHQRLHSARSRLHLSQAAAAAKSGIGASSISEFETGRREPSLAQLQVLAEIYQRPIAWMLGEGGGGTEDPIVLWRQRPLEEQASSIAARFLRLTEQYSNLEVWCGAQVECRLPELDGSPSRPVRSYDAAALAKRVRGELALGDRPGEGLLRTLGEACGVKVFHIPFEPSGTAACTRTDSMGASILLNRNNVPWRRSFDIAHELFHLITWSHFRSNSNGKDVQADDREESLANTFASNLLMPDEAFRLAIQSRTDGGSVPEIEAVYDVAREFSVSVDAVIVRMKQVLGTPDDEAERLKQEWRVWSLFGEARTRDDPPELPERYQALAMTALRRGEISIGRYAEYVGISRQKALEIARKQEIHDDEVDPPAPA